ncbi:hypothetical protein BD779DRAFT_250683 [Infundibulicybe gibba]|nr:hypothetical protein BD779DRAFT_250683 [Infundibulicybe gibba]
MDTNISDARDIHLNSCLLIFALVFLYYDHFITIDREIKFVWTQSKKPSTYWFLANRYFLFSVNIVVVLFEFTPLVGFPKSCESYSLSRQVLIAINQLLVSVLMTLRVYALYGCSFRVLGGMVIIGAATFSVACWALFSGQRSTVSQQFGCYVGLSYDTSTRLATAWEALFAYDSMIFALTLIKTWRAAWNIDIRKQRLPVITLLLRDGAIYFAVMALSNLANILTFYFCGPFLRGGLSAFSTRSVLNTIHMNGSG